MTDEYVWTFSFLRNPFQRVLSAAAYMGGQPPPEQPLNCSATHSLPHTARAEGLHSRAVSGHAQQQRGSSQRGH